MVHALMRQTLLSEDGWRIAFADAPAQQWTYKAAAQQFQALGECLEASGGTGNGTALPHPRLRNGCCR